MSAKKKGFTNEFFLELARKAMKGYSYTRDPAFYGLGFSDGTVERGHSRGCHGALSFKESITSKKIVAIFNGIRDNLDLREETAAYHYYDYLINRSPFKDCFVNKNIGEFKDIGIVVDLTRQPANKTISASIATRHPWERISVVNSFSTLVKDYGVDEDKAFLSAFLVEPTNEGKLLSRYICGHTCLYVKELDKSGIINFLNHTVGKNTDKNEASSKPYCEIHKYNTLTGVWNNSGYRGKYTLNINDKSIIVNPGTGVDPFNILPWLQKDKKEQETEENNILNAINRSFKEAMK